MKKQEKYWDLNTVKKGDQNEREETLSKKYSRGCGLPTSSNSKIQVKACRYSHCALKKQHIHTSTTQPTNSCGSLAYCEGAACFVQMARHMLQEEL